MLVWRKTHAYLKILLGTNEFVLFQNRPGYLLPFFCIQVFDFCLSCLTVVGYFSYAPNIKTWIKDQGLVCNVKQGMGLRTWKFIWIGDEQGQVGVNTPYCNYKLSVQVCIQSPSLFSMWASCTAKVPHILWWRHDNRKQQSANELEWHYLLYSVLHLIIYVFRSKNRGAYCFWSCPSLMSTFTFSITFVQYDFIFGIHTPTIKPISNNSQIGNNQGNDLMKLTVTF